MATKTIIETNGCTFQWKSENISHCWMKTGEGIDSLAFTADALQGSKWFLRLYPMGNDTAIVVYLYRAGHCSGPHSIDVSYQLDLLDKEGKILTERITLEGSFYKNSFSSPKRFERKNVFIAERAAFFPDDTLTVQCVLWKNQETLIKSKLISAQTVFKVNRRSFEWKIDEFSTLKPGVRYKFKDDLIGFDIVLIEGIDLERKLVIDVILFDKSIKYFSFQTSIIDSDGQNEDCGRHEYFSGDLKTGLLTTLLFTKKLMENKSRYLPNDVLSLDCECFYSTGTVSCQFYGCGIISSKVTKVAVEESNEHSVQQPNTQLTPVLANDLKFMYNEGIFSDTELRTPTKTFLIHKNILSARSPVFRRMFSSEMKEKNSGRVDISDLEDDTVNRMLLYMYTDSLGNLQLENACKLYAAAEKYEILSLRSRCSSFFKHNLITTKACDILVLAELYKDDDLKSAVQDFILRHDKEVFGSQEWKHLMASNIQLAADVMYRKVFPC